MNAANRFRPFDFPSAGIALACVLAAAVAPGQGVFDSGSTGADGALEFFTPPPAVQDFAMAYDSIRQVVVLFGGDISGFSNQTWEWDGVRWTQRTTANAPLARRSHAMAFDSARGVMVLFGGRDANNALRNDTWEYDGTNWTQKSPANSPSAREGHAMAYDAARQRIVMTCGFATANENDTWLYDGTTWVQQLPDLPAMRDHVMAYDSGRQRVVLHGVRRTFEWNGANWTEVVTSNNPLIDQNAAMVYDAGRQRCLLIQGFNNSTGRRTETYMYDGLNFVQLTTPTTPGARYLHEAAYDQASGQVVMFGGNNTVGQRSRETWILTDTDWFEPFQVDTTALIDMTTRPNGVYNYTTITVPAAFTVTFARNAANSPVIWLATGDVTINGTVNLAGQDGAASVDPGNEAQGGPGGFNGGLGGRNQSVSGFFGGTPGQGPGGGRPGTASGQAGGHAGHAGPGSGANNGPAYGNILANPIIGGSGGGGGGSSATGNGGGGGAGGGAILIASSGNINIAGTINCRGGNGRWSGHSQGGNGSGGSIRLVANRIQGAGTLDAEPLGRIRTEAFFVQLSGTVRPLNTSAPPIAVAIDNLGTVRIVNVAGQVVPANPGGNTNSPDVIFVNSGPIQIALATTNVPQGTVITVRITSSGEVITVQSTPVAADGSATATATVPAGVGTIQAFADYTVQ